MTSVNKKSDYRVFRVGDQVLDVHQITKRLGKGSMTRTYQVYRQDWDEHLILKVPRSRSIQSPQYLNNFTRQSHAWAGLGDHAHIATCHYIQPQQHIPYLFAEYVEGANLQTRINSGNLYLYDDSLNYLLDIAIQCARGLDYAHQHNILHTNFKSSNVIITPDDDVKITDFGLTPILPNDRHIDSVVEQQLVTWAYASPEQLEGLTLSAQSDIWNWAVTLLELFVGELSWSIGVAAPDVLAEYQTLASDDDERPIMPQALYELLDDCLQVNPHQRPESMSKVLDQLNAIYLAATTQPYPRQTLDLNTHSVAEMMTSNVLDHATLHYQHDQQTSTLPLPSICQDYLNNAQQAIEAHDYTQAVIEVLAARSEAVCNQTDDVMEMWSKLYLYLPRQKLRDGWQIHSEKVRINNIITTLKDCYAIIINQQGYAQLWHPLVGEHWIAKNASLPPIKVASASLCGRYVISGHDDHTLSLWDTKVQRCIQTFSGHQDPITTLALSTDLHYLLSGSQDHTIRLWDCHSGQCLQIYRHHKHPIRTVAFSADAQYAASVAEDKVAYQWALAHPKQQHTMLFNKIPSLIIASPNGQHLLINCDKQLYLWDIYNGNMVQTIKHDLNISALAIDINSEHILLGTTAGHIEIWNISLKRCEHQLTGHHSAISALSMTLDGRALFSADNDNIIKLWTLDWKIERHTNIKWDDNILYWLKSFLAQCKPYQGQLEAEVKPTAADVQQALSRHGLPTWTETQLQQLMYLLACAGYGQFTRYDIEHRLQSMLRFYPDPVQVWLKLKKWLGGKWQTYQLRWSQRHITALQKNDHKRRMQQQRSIAKHSKRPSKLKLKKKTTKTSSQAPISEVFIDIAKFIVIILVLHDISYYSIMMLTSVPAARRIPYNTSYLPIDPLTVIDPVELKYAENTLGSTFVQQRRALALMIYSKALPALISAEVLQLQATLNKIRDTIPIHIKLVGEKNKIRFFAQLTGSNNKRYEVPIKVQQGSEIDIHYDPSFADRLAKQINHYQAGKPAQLLWVEPYLLSFKGRLWHRPKLKQE